MWQAITLPTVSEAVFLYNTSAGTVDYLHDIARILIFCCGHGYKHGYEHRAANHPSSCLAHHVLGLDANQRPNHQLIFALCSGSGISLKTG
jgi:hypothetical protein